MFVFWGTVPEVCSRGSVGLFLEFFLLVESHRFSFGRTHGDRFFGGLRHAFFGLQKQMPCSKSPPLKVFHSPVDLEFLDLLIGFLRGVGDSPNLP